MKLPRLIAAATPAIALSAAVASASPSAMNAKEARHLLARTGFGSAPNEIEAMVGKSYAEGVREIIAGLSAEPSQPMPPFSRAWAYPTGEIYVLGQVAEELFYANRYTDLEALSAWWLGEMVATPSPLTERLTLFWHDHFATSFDHDENPQWMANQNAMFRAHAAGNFVELASAALRDPALLSYLSNTENVAEAPNENLGREFFELFTLGQGRGYTEQDVKEAARALTGHSVAELGAPNYAFYPEEHDRGRKTILGQTGRFSADDLPRLATEHEAFGPYIVEKLWLHFISDSPDPAEVERLSKLWRAADFQMKPLLEALFLSDAFWDEANRGRLVKGPIELMVGAIRTLGVEGVHPLDVVYSAEEMGQALFFPPNVAGWPAGTGWITDATAMTRATMMVDVANYEPEEWDAPEGEIMMLSATDEELITDIAPSDLRVGQALALLAEKGPEDEPFIGGLITLFDVTLAGQTFRSLPVFFERWGDEAPELSLHLGDCLPDCAFASGLDPIEDEPWLWLPLSDEMREVHGDLTQTATASLATLTALLPDLLNSTLSQRVWNTDWEEYEEETPASFEETAELVAEVAAEGERLFGAGQGALVTGFSRPNAFGLGEARGIRSIEALEAYFDEMEEPGFAPISPAATYENLEDWAAALPKGVAPEDVLLAVPFTGSFPEGASAEDKIRALMLAPEFQLN
ncbi:MAG: DUF1800 domain-containing protein [Pseudomonadota bacterium]